MPNSDHTHRNDRRLTILKRTDFHDRWPGAIAIAVALCLMPSVAFADTKRVEYNYKKPQPIDVLASVDSASCHSILTDAKVTKQPKNGRLTIKSIMWKADRGQCKGRNIKIFGIIYQPKRGFRGKDEASISYRAPPRRYHGQLETIKRSNKYIITVK